jgi:hypothetical protein
MLTDVSEVFTSAIIREMSKPRIFNSRCKHAHLMRLKPNNSSLLIFPASARLVMMKEAMSQLEEPAGRYFE